MDQHEGFVSNGQAQVLSAQMVHL